VSASFLLTGNSWSPRLILLAGGGDGGASAVFVFDARAAAAPVAVRRHDADEGVRGRAGVGNAVGGAAAAL
jgi:hypothetical protein